MLPAELFEVELLDTDEVRAPCLPARIMPLPGEALASWLLRYAGPFGVSPETLLLDDDESALAASPEWWRKPDPAVMTAIARSTGVPDDAIRPLYFTDCPTTGVMTRCLNGSRVSALPVRSHRARGGGSASALLALQRTRFRREWTLGWMAACPMHGAVLVQACPDCGARLRLPALSSADHFAPDRCPRCAFRLARPPSRFVPTPVLRLQRRLFTGRPDGIIDLPEIGPLAWTTVVALFDVLLGAVWIDTKPKARSQLFARIDRDIGSELGEAAEGCDGLIILAWMLDAWPMRVQAAHAILRAVRPRRQMQRWPNLDAMIRSEVENLLRTTWPNEQYGPDRAWAGVDRQLAGDRR